jgi:hypothetical protein
MMITTVPLPGVASIPTAPMMIISATVSKAAPFLDRSTFANLRP